MAERFTAEQIAQAITEAQGVMAVAARRLGCSRATVHNYVNKYPTVKAAWEDARETLVDFTETQLFKQIEQGNITAIIFALKTIGKHRGYIERHEVTGKEGGPVAISAIRIVAPEADE